MWLLLVAAGSGYLARCWQNALKTRPALTDCAQISSRPGSPTNSAATSGFGSPPNTWEKGSGTSKEDPQTGRKAHELRRQLSSGGKPFHVKGLGRKLLYDSCGQGSSRFSRSDDGLDGTDERKRLIDNAGSFSDDDDTGKKSGACCGLGGSKRSDVSESSVAGLTTVGGRSYHELTLHNPDVDENEKGPSFFSTPCPDVPCGQEENTFEISLLKDEIFSVPSMACVNGPSLSVSTDDLRKGFSVSEKAIHRRSTTTDSLFGFSPPPNDAPSSCADATGTEPCWEPEELESPSAASGRSDVCINSRWTPVPRESGKLAEGEPGGELQVLGTHSKVLFHAAGSGVGRPSSPGSGGMHASCFDQPISCENVQCAQSELDVCYQYQEQGCGTTTTGFVDCLTSPESACLQPRDTDSGPNFEPPGTVLLSFFSGKRVNDFSSGASKDGNEDPGLSSGKRKKDSFSGRQEDGAAHEPLASNLSSGLLDPSLGCLGFDATWFEMEPDGDEKSRNGWTPRKIKTPSRCSRGKACIRKARWLKGSPKVVSSLESCLRAQLVHDISKDNDHHASRALYFQSTSEGGTLPEMRNNSSDMVQVPEQAQEEPTVPRKMYGRSHSSGANVAVGLPSLENHVQMGTGKQSSPRECKSSLSQVARTMLDVSSRRCHPLSIIMKKRKTSDKGQTLSTSLQFEREGSRFTKDMVLQPIDGLLFSFGVGVGVMSMVNTSKEEIEKISTLLRQSQEHVELLKQELRKVPHIQTGLLVKAISGGNFPPEVKSDLVQLRRAEHGETNKLLATSEGLALEEANRAGGMVEVQQNGDHMAELEAELEAELQLMELNLTGDSSSCHRRQFSGLSDLDLDGVADVVEGELKESGLSRPADPDDDQIASTHDEEVHPNNWAVSPRDLDRRLRKLLITRQEENIAELEAELEVAENKLSSKEKELQWWKDRFQKVTQLTGLSSKPAEGSVSAIPYGDDTGEEKAGELFTPVGNRDLKVVGKTTGGSPEGMPVQHPLTDTKRKSSVARRATEKVTFNEHAELDAVLFSEALASETANDDVCDEFLKAVIERETGATTGDDKYELANILSPIPNRSQEDSLFGKTKRGQAGLDTGRGTFSSGNSNPLTRIQYPQEHSVSENVQLMQAGSSPTVLISSPTSKKQWTTRVDEVWGPMKLYATRFGSDKDELQATAPSQDNEWEAGRPRPIIVNTDVYGGSMRHVHPDLSSPLLEPVGNTAIFGPTSEIVDVDDVESVTACITDASERTRHWNSGAVSRAGANTPVDSLILQQVASTSQEAFSVLIDGQESRGASSSVLAKVKHWEDMVRRDSPVALGRLSDWDAQSWTSESEQVHPLVGEDLLLGAEATLGEILIKRIVEKTRRGSHIVKVAETALTTGDDNGEVLPSQNALTSQAAQVLIRDDYPPVISSAAYYAPPGAKVEEDRNIDISSSDDFARFLNASPQTRVRHVERSGHEDPDESCAVSEEPAESGERYRQGKRVPLIGTS